MRADRELEASLEGLNAPQREAVLHEGGPLLILAGAGSGKTRVLVHRIAHLIRARGWHPAEIMAVTFTRKAARELEERVRRLLPDVQPAWWVGTFHGLGARMLRSLAEHCGREPGFVIFDEDDQLRLLRGILEAGSWRCEIAPRDAREAIEAAKRELATPREAQERAAGLRQEALAEVFARYESELARMNGFDFSDLVGWPVRLFDDEPELRGRWAQRFREVLVDEYQDTHRTQVRMVAHLVSPDGRISAVGDDDQSIYAWRGATVENILHFDRDFSAPCVIRLEENYRSTGAILQAANAVIAHNEGRHEKRLWTRAPRGEPPVLLALADEEAEAEAAVEIVRNWAREGDRDPGEVAVLYRTNAQSRPLEDAFRRARIPYRLVGSIRFYDRREVKDLLAYFRVVVNPRDEVSLQRIVNVPPRGIGPRTMERLERWAGAAVRPLSEALGVAEAMEGATSAQRQRLANLGGLFADWRARLGREPLDDLGRRIVEESGYLAWLAEEQGFEGRERAENAQELLASLEAYSWERPGAGLAEYLEEIATTADIDGWSAGREAVTLMTLHNAKGLEFPGVIITGLEEGLLPHRSAVEGGRRDMEEERRLLYVGLTRARERVWLTASAWRRSWDGPSSRALSRFLAEFPADALEVIELAPPRHPARARRAWGGGDIQTSGDPFPRYEDGDPDPGGAEGMDPGDLRPGEWVRHPEWGAGKIVEREGRGSSLKLTILFEGRRRKKVMARYAHLERM